MYFCYSYSELEQDLFLSDEDEEPDNVVNVPIRVGRSPERPRMSEPIIPVPSAPLPSETMSPMSTTSATTQPSRHCDTSNRSTDVKKWAHDDKPKSLKERPARMIQLLPEAKPELPDARKRGRPHKIVSPKPSPAPVVVPEQRRNILSAKRSRPHSSQPCSQPNKKPSMSKFITPATVNRGELANPSASQTVNTKPTAKRRMTISMPLLNSKIIVRPVTPSLLSLDCRNSHSPVTLSL